MLRRFLPAAVFAVSFTVSHAQQDAPAVNAEAILRELEQIEQKQKQELISSRQMAVNQVKAAAASGSAAADLYERAVEAIQFEGTKNKGAAYADWKSSKAPMLRTNEGQAALTLHLRYLALSLERKGSDKPDLFVQPSLTYARDLAATDATFIKQALSVTQQAGSDRDRERQAVDREAIKLKDDLLNKSLNDSVFVKWLRLGSSLPKGEDWELTPGNLSGILEKNVRTPLRAAKNPVLLVTYEQEMQFLADRVSSSRREHDATDFNTLVRPRIQLARADDMAALGQKNRAVNEIFMLVKTYPQHPDFSKWLARLRELLTPESAAPAETPASAAPTAPAN